MKSALASLMLASLLLRAASAAATTVTTPQLAVASPGYFFACYVLNVSKKTVEVSIQILRSNGEVLGLQEPLLLGTGENILVTNSGAPDPAIAHCRVDYKGPKGALRVSLCRAATVGNVAECSSSVVTGQ
jgi:hypothetical protein